MGDLQKFHHVAAQVDSGEGRFQFLHDLLRAAGPIAARFMISPALPGSLTMPSGYSRTKDCCAASHWKRY